MDSDRWVEVSPSQFTHEAEGLRLIRDLLPDVEPFRAWSNFEFRDVRGRWHEVDLAVLGRDTLYLIELKYYSGRLRGDDHRWRRDGHPAEDSPLKLAHRKAQYLASLLKERFREYLRSKGEHNVDLRDYIPFVQEAVFLHHPNLRCELPEYARRGIYGLEGQQHVSGLQPLSELLLAPARHEPISARQSAIFAALMKQIGLVPRRQREVGSWVIDDEPLADGDGWQDWPAFHRVTTTDRCRIRFYIPEPGSGSAAERKVERRAEYEYRLLSRLRHDGVLTPRDLVKAELGTGLVYTDDHRLRRLDLWFAEQEDGLPLREQLDIIRQVAEALHYAHRHRVVHRGLAPSAVAVRERSGGGLAVVVSNWEAAGTVPAMSATQLSASVVSEEVTPGLPGNFADEDELFAAPEGRWIAGADRIRLDVFALGALAYYVLTNQTLPAQDRGALVERLRRDGGLDVAAELPQVPSAIRQLVLDASSPRPSERTASVADFLEQLAAAEERLFAPTLREDVDPLDAGPGALLGGRYKFLRRLGSGSTAVGLLVADEAAGGKQRVLKVAKDAAAEARLETEAKALGSLDHDHIVDFLDITQIGGRQVLVLAYAGDATLAEELARKRGRLSLDLLERWGADLLSALVELDRVGIFHRDIKPSNLGIKAHDRRSRRTADSRLVLFDFSMSGTDLRALAAGTPHYRDPFLGQDDRLTYDSAAELYGAAVVLYEMATAKLPHYGRDPDADPASVPDDVSIDGESFDPAVREDLEAFFATALSRHASRRHDTAEDMRRAWTNIFERLGRQSSGDLERAATATLDSTLGEAGLSARAVSALESEVTTVVDLLMLDPVRLNRLVGKEAKATRTEVRDRVREWRKTFADQLAARRGRDSARPEMPTTLPDPVRAAVELAKAARYPRSETRQKAAELILGLAEGLDPFASQQELAVAVGRSGPRGHQLVKELQDAWARNDQCRDLLDQLVRVVTASLDTLGGVATIKTLTDEILATLPDVPPSQRDQARRVAAGLLRLALDRYVEFEQAESHAPLAKRRHGGRLALVATHPALLDAADAVAEVASKLVAAGGDDVVPQQRAAREIRTQFDSAFRAASGSADGPPAMTDLRLVRLAAQAATDVGLSTRGELHSLGLAQHVAVRLALAGVGHHEKLKPGELVNRVRARFPDLEPLPARPALDAIVERAGIGLRFADGVYGPEVSAPPATSGLPSRVASVVPEVTEFALSRSDHLDRLLAESLTARSFLALGVAVRRSDEVDRAVTTLSRRFEAQVVDITGVVIDEMRAVAEQAGLPWNLVRSADAAAAGSRDARGLRALVERVMPRVAEHIDSLVLGEAKADERKPVILTELSPLARYGHLGVVARWSDLAARRSRPVWLVVPQVPWMRGAAVDGKPLQLGSNGQFVQLDAGWLAAQEQHEAVTG
ncbi:BREX system serine/threonine kinase PglW [Kibdelosporangium philippinense]|uniref:non-specific serine/threonine protein kinase n=1 Tax=Kibdelosporangium philippinense TaxID=211113 RepID=A0ABS8Z4U7_9PSEU|nr:BREX system serine/threonine kinase PglW [Kibdelosporangium philippinense]MCE7001661.1 BREX system serine/threonine kinase PglW [Kibdelosporangium philippinense]